jgi:hypothetical protein
VGQRRNEARSTGFSNANKNVNENVNENTLLKQTTGRRREEGRRDRWEGQG